MLNTTTKSKEIERPGSSPKNSAGIFLANKFSCLLYSVIMCVSVNAQNCAPATAFDYLDINNVKARIDNGGNLWKYAQYIVPKSGNISSIGLGAFWIGGLDAQGNLHVAAQTYGQNGNDFFPGPLDSSGNVTAQTCDDFDRIWKINKSTVDSFAAGQFATTPVSISEWPGRNNPNLAFLPDQDLAPFIDLNGDHLYHPDHGDFPAIPGDQALWFVFNDNGNTHSETGGLPLGIEVQCLGYAVKDSSACTYSTTFYHYKIINKSTKDYDSVYMGLWADPDLGCYVDDYVGTDSVHNLGVTYNADSIDGPSCVEGYGNQPPVLALQLLKGPTDDNGITHYLDHSMVYYNDFSVVGNPESANEYYNYLKSVWKDNTHLTYGGSGLSPSNFFYSGDPSDPNGWSACSGNAVYSDQRFVISSGPISMQHGETKTFDLAVVWDNTSVYPCPSFDIIDSVAACVKDYFNNIVFISGADDISSLPQHLNVFPNPVAISSDINFSGKDISRIEIFDLAGKKFFDSETKKNDVLKLNSDRLGRGLFIYRFSLSDHSSQSGKLVIQ